MKNLYKDKYWTQKSGARSRNIEWQFTFESWMEWWGDDIVNRGNKSGQLVMARNNDSGPYHPDNVRKITANENHKEAHINGLAGMKGKTHSTEARAKISEKGKGRIFTPEHRAKLNATKIGVPRSPEVREKIRATLLARNKE